MNKKITDTTLVDVYNNTPGTVAYRSGINHAKRKWDKPDSVKKISVAELRDLINTRGGEKLLLECLLIKDVAVREELSLPLEPEHLLGKQEIEQLLKDDAEKLDEILGNTNDGVKEKVVAIAIDNKITDTEKMEVIKDHTGIDVYAAIKEKKEEEKDAANPTKTDKGFTRKTK